VAVEVRAGIIEGIEKMIQIMGGNVNYPTQPTNPNKAIINKAIKMYREMMAFNASDKSSKTAVKGKKSNKCLDVDKSPDGICVKKGNK
jgi:hypothetical protein